MLAERWKISREDMDEYSLESHRRAAEATDSGHFAREILPVPIKDENGALTGETLSADEGIRRETTIEQLAALPRSPEVGAGHCSRHHSRELVADDRRRVGDARRRATRRRTARPSDKGPLRPFRRGAPRTRRSCCRLRCR